MPSFGKLEEIIDHITGIHRFLPFVSNFAGPICSVTTSLAWDQCRSRDGEERGGGWKESHNLVYYSFSTAQGTVGHETGSISRIYSIFYTLGRHIFSLLSDHFSRLQLRHESTFHEFHEGAFLGNGCDDLSTSLNQTDSTLSLGLAPGCLEDDEALLLYALIRAVRHDPGHGISKMWMKCSGMMKSCMARSSLVTSHGISWKWFLP